MKLKILERYLLRAFLKVSLILLVVITALIAIANLLERYPDLSEYSPSFSQLSLYFLYTIPGFGGYVLPMVTLLAVIFTLGQASRHKEILVISASGGRLKEVLKPFIVVGVIITLISVIFTNLVMPLSKRLTRASLEEIKKEPVLKGVLGTSQGIWFRSGERIMRIGLYEPQLSEAKDIGIYEIEKGLLLKRIEARSGFLKEDEWELRDVWVYELKRDKGERLSAHYETYGLKSSRYSLRLLRAESAPEEMDSSRLWRYLRALKKSGLKNLKHLIDFNLRLSLPIASIAMMLIGLYLGSARGLSGLVGAGAGTGIIILFWFSTTFMLSMGYSGVLPAWVAPWITPLSALTIGIFLYKKIE